MVILLMLRAAAFVFLYSLLSTAFMPAAEIRVATFNIGAHWGTSYYDYSLGAPGTVDHESVKSILARINADVVALQEIYSTDVAGSPSDLQILAAALGYSHVYVAPVSSSGTLAGPFDTGLRNAFLSRHPFLSATAIRSPAGAKELARLHAVVKVDVPGTTNDPVIICAHLKSEGGDNRFRRAVEMRRLVGHLGSTGLTDDDNFVVLGDFNLNPAYGNTTYFSLPTTSEMPSGFILGNDVTFPVSYSINPVAYFSTPIAIKLDPRQLNNSPSTYNTTSPGGPTLDMILVSPAIAGRTLDSEIYNSILDVSNDSGLVKAGLPLAGSASADASDHYAVFADLDLDSERPNLDIVLSAPFVTEGSPSGTVTATVTLPATRPSTVNVTVSSDDPAAASPVGSTIVIPAGLLAGSVSIQTPRNFIADPQRSVAITASASGYDPDVAVLQVNDADGPYVFTAPGQTVVEGFNGFSGNHDPAPWSTTGGLVWRGVGDGSSSVSGLRSYGATPDGSLGILPQGTSTTAAAMFINQSAVPLTALQITLDAEQWRSAFNGTADVIHAELLTSAGTVPLPGLSFAASRSLPNGPVAGGATTPLQAMVTGLSVPPGDFFELKVSFVPGSNVGVAPSDVFINEFHYDNDGTDTGEFVEVVVAPGFTGQLADIDVALYNGETASAGVVYNTLNLATGFTHVGTYANYKIFVANLSTNGIQNGPRDGFAVFNKITSQVLQFISYEGVFTASSGPASGMTFTNIGVSQSGTEPEGMSSLGLTGTGGAAADFTWIKAANAYTKGAPNEGQTFVLPTLPSQGIAIDNVSVMFLTDYDLDGLPDITDPDDDNDGQQDGYETAFGTDPLDAASRFMPVIARSVSGIELSFPGAVGIHYTVEYGDSLEDWDELTTVTGEGIPIVVRRPMAEPTMFFRVKAGGVAP